MIMRGIIRRLIQTIDGVAVFFIAAGLVSLLFSSSSAGEGFASLVLASIYGLIRWVLLGSPIPYQKLPGRQ